MKLSLGSLLEPHYLRPQSLQLIDVTDEVHTRSKSPKHTDRSSIMIDTTTQKRKVLQKQKETSQPDVWLLLMGGWRPIQKQPPETRLVKCFSRCLYCWAHPESRLRYGYYTGAILIHLYLTRVARIVRSILTTINFKQVAS